MKLLAVFHYPVFGGPQNRSVRLRTALERRGVDLLAVLPAEPGDAAERMRGSGMRVAEMPLARIRGPVDPLANGRFLRSYRGDVRRLRGLIRRERADLVVLAGLPNSQAAVAARLEDVPLVWQIVDSRAPAPLVVAAMPFVRRLSDAVMFWGEPVRDQHLRGRVLNVPTFLAHSAVDLGLYRPDAQRRAEMRAELGVPEAAMLIGMVGNVNPQKGVEDYVETARRILDQRSDVFFVQAGARYETHRDYAAHLDSTVAAMPAGRFRFLGPRDDLHRLYAALDVQLITSTGFSEGVPTVALEGMACGVPIVATDAGSTRTVVRADETGIVVAPGDVEALATATTALLDDPARRQAFGESAHMRAQAEFGIDAVADLHMQVFAAATAHHASRR